MNLYIKVGSITIAQRSVNILRSKGYKPQIKRIDNPSKEDGCGYAVEVYSQGDEPVEILERNAIKIRGVEYR